MAVKSENPLISIIMPTYNRANVIERALGSVINQSYPHFELHIVDDGSDDNTEEILDKHLSAEKKITFSKIPKSGVSQARNYGLMRARGELVAYLDTDNRWHLDFLRMMVEQLKGSSLRCGYAAHNRIDNINGKHELWNTPYDRDILKIRNFIDLNIFIHEKSLFDELGGFDENLARFVDWDLVLRYTENNDPFFLNLALADYFCDSRLDQISHTASYLENYRKIMAKYSPENFETSLLLEKYPNKKEIDAIVEKVLKSGLSRSAVYGAGAFGELLVAVLRQFGHQPCLLVDSNPGKWEKRVQGLRCGRPDEVVGSGCEMILVASEMHKHDIENQILDMYQKSSVECPLVIHS